MNSGTFAWLGGVCVWVCIVSVASQRVFREDRLALLSGTLRTLRAGACDGDSLSVKCPPTTSISIQLVRYGRFAKQPDRCGTTPSGNHTKCVNRSALKEVVVRCAGKQRCQLYVSPETFGSDPCPGVGKYIEVLYKCRPTEFRSSVVCDGQRKTIYCGRDRVAIYSAVFGTKASGSIHCAQPPGAVLTDCQAGFMSEKLISQCQGRSSCLLTPHAAQLGRGGCPDGHHMYLTATYTCLPPELFTDQYRYQEEKQTDADYQQNETAGPAPPPHFNEVEVGQRDAPFQEHEEHYRVQTPAGPGVGVGQPPSSAGGRQSVVIYALLAVSGVLLLSLGVVLGRLCVRYRFRHDPVDTAPPPPVLSDLIAGSDVTDYSRSRLSQLDLTAVSGQPGGSAAQSTYQSLSGRSRRSDSLSPSTASEELDRYAAIAFGGNLESVRLAGKNVRFGNNLDTNETALGGNDVRFGGSGPMFRGSLHGDRLGGGGGHFGDDLDGGSARLGGVSLRYPTVAFGERSEPRAVTFGDSLSLLKPANFDARPDGGFRLQPVSGGDEMSGSLSRTDQSITPPHSAPRSVPPTVYFHS